MKSTLDKRFIHSSWYRDGKTTVREAITSMSRCGDFKIKNGFIYYNGTEGGKYKINNNETLIFAKYIFAKEKLDRNINLYNELTIQVAKNDQNSKEYQKILDRVSSFFINMDI